MPRSVHYVLSTHWDREWHQPFQDFRYRLVQLLDRILDGQDQGRLKGPFVCDGQAIIFEDYLEVRRDQEARVRQAVGDGRLVGGPWYVMPDEFLVSGESLIRNLRLGRQIVRDLGGKPSDAGFICDIFGHTSQMPQIFAGFGIPVGFIWRGVKPQGRHVIWQGADGTELPCFVFSSNHGYCNFAHVVRQAGDCSVVLDPANIRKNLDTFVQAESAATLVDPLLAFDGGDHQEWDQAVYEQVAARLGKAHDEFEWVHSTLDDYMKRILPQADRIAHRLVGELREPARETSDHQWMIPGVLSSRVWIKQQNAACETLLCHWAEPWSLFSHLKLGLKHPRGFLDLSWRWLLQNHPHDSICGCSIDDVHRDVAHRFRQARQIAQHVLDDCQKSIAWATPAPDDPKAIRVVVFNPLPVAVERSVELTLNIPTDWPTFNEFFGYEPKPAFTIADSAGRELPFQRLAQTINRIDKHLFDTRFPAARRVHQVTVAAPLALPAMGYAALTVKPGQAGHPVRYPQMPGMATGWRSMANEFLGIVIESNGTITLTDKATGRIYRDLLTFEDSADIGDGWFHGQAVNDQIFVSTGSPCDIALTADGPYRTTFRLRTTMRVPRAFDFTAMRRSSDMTELVIDSHLTLTPGSHHLEIATTVHNSADDHRLRVLLPSGAGDATTYWADAIFDVIERPIALRKDNHRYRELEVETKPQRTWTAVSDAAAGLAVITQGLLESAVRDVPLRPIALTLLRGTRRTVMTDGEPEGQVRGVNSFRYRLAPIAGKPDVIALGLSGQELAAGLTSVQIHPEDALWQRACPPLPATDSFLNIDGPVLLSSCRMVDDALELRLHNPTDQTAKVRIRLSPSLWPGRSLNVTAVNLESRPTGPGVAIADHVIHHQIAGKKLVTLRVSAVTS